jgi:hypothetical protein
MKSLEFESTPPEPQNRRVRFGTVFQNWSAL